MGNVGIRLILQTFLRIVAIPCVFKTSAEREPSSREGKITPPHSHAAKASGEAKDAFELMFTDSF